MLTEYAYVRQVYAYDVPAMLSSLAGTKNTSSYQCSSSSSVYSHSNLVTFSDWLRMLAHIDTGNRKFDARGN